MVTVKKPYSRYLKNSETLPNMRSGLLPHGYVRYQIGNRQWGFHGSKPVPRYWFSGNLVSRLSR